MNAEVTVGCDPEFFIQKVERRTKQVSDLDRLFQESLSAKKKDYRRSDSVDGVLPICGLVGGSKEKPRPLAELGEGYSVQEDGIACEFNIPPQDSPADFSAAVGNALRTIESELQGKGFGRSYINAVELRPEWTQRHPNLLQIGCEPDYCAYDKIPAPRVLDMSKIGTIRGAGGHVHLGYPVKLCPPHIVARFLDCVLAIPTLEDDPQGNRRKFWGVAGLFRPKPYGIEYRTLSNFWIWSGILASHVSAHAIALIYGLQRNMVQWQAFYNSTNWEAVDNCIYTENVSQARDLYTRFRQFKCFNDLLHHAGELMYQPKSLSYNGIPVPAVAHD